MTSPQISPDHFLVDGVVARRPPAEALTPLHLAVILSLALGAVVFGATLILGGEGLQFQKYLALLGVFGASCAVFVGSRIRGGNVQLFELPVYLTAIFFLRFGLLPLRNFFDPAQIDANLSANGEELVQALAYIILGMMAFWVGCELARRKGGERITADPGSLSGTSPSDKRRVLIPFAAMFAVGFITKLYLLKNQLYSYTGSLDKYYDNLGSMQVLNFVAQFGTLGLIVVAIERYRHPKDELWRILFAAALATEIFWGLISGMKGLALQNFILVAVVSSLVMKRLNMRWIVILILGLVLLYPISEAYRSVLIEGNTGVSSFEGAAQAGQMAFHRAGEGGATAGSLGREGLDATFLRLDLLTCVAQVLTLGPRASLVKGDERWWMIPIYPFVPRSLWPSKPILNEGQRFNFALAGGSGDTEAFTSSTAVTYPGDLFIQFGLWGIPVGMFALGIVAQWLTNRLSASVEPRELFVYTAVFLLGFPLEADVFLLWTSLIKLLAIFYVLRLLIYGPLARRRRLAASFPVPDSLPCESGLRC
jgi:hypothetical protein